MAVTPPSDIAAQGGVNYYPLTLGFRQHPVVDPATRRGVGDCAVPAYRVDLEDLRCLLIPQMGLACRKCTWTVDFLCAVIGRGGAPSWFLVEIDGDGHDSSSDRFREQDIAMPTIRLTEAEVTQGEPLTMLPQQVRAVLATPRLHQERACETDGPCAPLATLKKAILPSWGWQGRGAVQRASTRTVPTNRGWQRRRNRTCEGTPASQGEVRGEVIRP